jgi:hypothetical protein
MYAAASALRITASVGSWRSLTLTLQGSRGALRCSQWALSRLFGGFLISHLSSTKTPALCRPGKEEVSLVHYLSILSVGIFRYKLTILIDPNVKLTALIKVRGFGQKT